MQKRKPGRPPLANGKTAKVYLRLPASLDKLIEVRAKVNKRTKSAELLLAIEAGINHDQAQNS